MGDSEMQQQIFQVKEHVPYLINLFELTKLILFSHKYLKYLYLSKAKEFYFDYQIFKVSVKSEKKNPKANLTQKKVSRTFKIQTKICLMESAFDQKCLGKFCSTWQTSKADMYLLFLLCFTCQTGPYCCLYKV